jgi:hypothetical protein
MYRLARQTKQSQIACNPKSLIYANLRQTEETPYTQKKKYMHMMQQPKKMQSLQFNCPTNKTKPNIPNQKQ